MHPKKLYLLLGSLSLLVYLWLYLTTKSSNWVQGFMLLLGVTFLISGLAYKKKEKS
jgi:hypothetical protein